jgi:hypothetical protein
VCMSFIGVDFMMVVGWGVSGLRPLGHPAMGT